MVTPEEQRAIRAENAKDDKRSWGDMRDMNANPAEDHKGLIAAAEAKKAAFERGAAEAGEKAEAAKGRVAALERGESVPGGMGKRPAGGPRLWRTRGGFDTSWPRPRGSVGGAAGTGPQRGASSRSDTDVRTSFFGTCVEIGPLAKRAR